MKNILLTTTLIFMVTTTFSQITNVGELKIEEGTELLMEDFYSNNSSGSLINNGSVTFNNSFNDFGITNISPSSSTIVNGNYKNFGILEITINGPLAGDALGHSQLNVIGGVSLSSSTINITIDPAYLPSDGTSHTIILYSGNLTGVFNTVNIISTSGWFVDYSISGEVNVIRDSVLDVENLDKIYFSVYPNPTSGLLSIQTKERIEKIEIYDINGRLIFNKSRSTQIDISNLSVGLYMLKVIDENGKSSTKKIIKN